MDNEEILERFKRQQSTRKTRFPDLMGVPSQTFSPVNEQPSRNAATPAPRREKKSRRRMMPLALSSRNTVMIVIFGIGILGIVGGGVAITKWRHNKAAKATAAATTQSTPADISFALYYPKNLPQGFTYNNDGKVLKTDVYYFSINGPKNDIYHITQQPIPANFDFVAFNKKFATPDTFNTSAGTVTAGAVGPTMLGSIRTNKNSWIIINSTETATISNLETVARSFELDQ